MEFLDNMFLCHPCNINEMGRIYKISHSKFWFLVVVQTMGVNIKLQEVRAH